MNIRSTDVQDAIHAPHINWEDCSSGSVYINRTTGRAGRDQSIPSTLSVLPNVIEKSERTVIVHGLAVSLKRCPTTRFPLTSAVGLHSDRRGHSNCDSVRLCTRSHLRIFCLTVTPRNMTWDGAQGFQTPIEPESFTVQDFGVFGAQHTERKLTCASAPWPLGDRTALNCSSQMWNSRSAGI